MPAAFGAALSKYGILKGIGFIATTNIAGLGVTWTIQYGQREYMRSDNDFSDNEIYRNMNETVDENTFFQTIDDPSDTNDIDALTKFSDAVNNGEIAIDNQQLKNDFGKLEKLSDYKLRKSEHAKQIFKDLNDGKYGSDAKNQIKSKYARWIGNNRKNVALGKQVAANNFKSAIKKMGKNAGQGALFFLPFLGTYFSENARKAFAEEALKDLVEGKGINVVTETPFK